MVGIIQEQHPDRCRLFMQWKEMGWPILVDSLNLLEVTAVPLTFGIDEYGVIRRTRLRVDSAAEIEDDFLAETFEPLAGQESAAIPEQPQLPDLSDLEPSAGGTALAFRHYANALTMWGGEERIDDAIAAYRQALALEPNHGPSHFRLGVALRQRYDSPRRQSGDFQAAVNSWSTALDTDPNQYIWRRRIQQYGPRLDKPYPFYDWVDTAREEIVARGGTPSELVVEPGGAEIAHPLEEFAPATETVSEPDPDGRIHRDDQPLIEVETAMVPAAVAPGTSVRGHAILRPNETLKAHWNNEASGLVFWLDAPEDWLLSQRRLTVDNPPEAVSLEPRKIEFEVKVPEDAAPGMQAISGYALYYVCEDVDGTCLYRRRDIEFPVQVTSAME